MYAVIDFKGHQYIVKVGDKVVVDNLNVDKGEMIDIDKVLLLFDEDGNEVKLGYPYLDGVKVVAKVVDHKKGEKIHVVKFKNKNRYFRKIGFRPKYTILEIEDIKS